MGCMGTSPAGPTDVDAVTVLPVLVLHVCLLRDDGARLTAMLVWRMDEV